MTIFDLKEYFKNTEEPKFFLKNYFSWRGNYSEIAFTPSTHGSKEDTLSLLEDATRRTCTGWKFLNYQQNKLYNSIDKINVYRVKITE